MINATQEEFDDIFKDDNEYDPWDEKIIIPQFLVMMRAITEGFLNQIMGDDEDMLLAAYDKGLQRHRDAFSKVGGIANSGEWTKGKYCNNVMMDFINLEMPISAKSAAVSMASLLEFIEEVEISNN